MERLSNRAAGVIKVIVKPNARKNAVLGFDDARQAYRISLAAPAEKGKANKELLKYLRSITEKECKIISGHASKTKLVRLL